MAGQDWFEKDFYAVLGVSPDASADQVKKAYRKLARQHHPDANAGDDEAERRFKEVGEAYAVLSDPEQRQQYDAVRAMARGGARFTAGGPGGGAGFEDLLGGLFGGAPAVPVAGGTSASPRAAAAPGRTSRISSGCSAGRAPAVRPGGRRASRSRGRARTSTAETTLDVPAGARGRPADLRSRTASPTAAPTARIPAGVRDGQKVRLRGRACPTLTGASRATSWSRFTCSRTRCSHRRHDVRVTLPVTFPEAASARSRGSHPGRRHRRLRVPAGTPSGRTLRVKGRGVRGGRPGDLLVTVQVAVPQRLDGDARAAVEAFGAATADENPRADLMARVQRDQRGPAMADEPSFRIDLGFTVEETTPVFVISVAAQLAGMHPQTLRQYDRLGLVSPGRTAGRGRRYSPPGRRPAPGGAAAQPGRGRQPRGDQARARARGRERRTARRAGPAARRGRGVAVTPLLGPPRVRGRARRRHRGGRPRPATERMGPASSALVVWRPQRCHPATDSLTR